MFQYQVWKLLGEVECALTSRNHIAMLGQNSSEQELDYAFWFYLAVYPSTLNKGLPAAFREDNN